jgi:hypothetical protein
MCTRSAEKETMDCLKCKNLKGALEFKLSEYVATRSSAYYRVSTELAAKKNVDVERARYDLEEHRTVCASYAERKLLG